MPRVSVIMPVYNRTPYFEEAVESILGQRYRDFEFIIVSDPHPDVTDYDFIDKYAEKDKRVIHIHNETRLGVAASRNLGIKKANGEFWAVMDADDLSGPRRLEIQVLHMDAYPEIGALGIRFAVEGSKTWMNDRPSFPEMVKAIVMFYPPFCHPTMMFRMEATNKYNLFYTSDLNEDFYLQQQMSKYVLMSNIDDENLFTYRVHAENTSKDVDSIAKEHRMMIVDSHFKETLGMKLSHNEQYSLRTFDYFKNVPKYKIATKLKLFEKTLLKIHNKNLSVGYCTRRGMSAALHHIWDKQIFILSRQYLGYQKLPHSVRTMYENSFFRKQIINIV